MHDYAAIRRLIPHAHPILLVDKVLEMEPYERIVTSKTVSGSEPCYAGLAPDLGSRAFAYPASLLMESWGQGGAILWMERIRAQRRERSGALILAATRKVALHRAVMPGDTLRHVVRVDQYVGDNVFLSGESYVGDELVAEVGSAIAVMRPAELVSWEGAA
ncbi:3-hydroxyacyl-ACP dehydratase FabZ family protein [Wenjunlia tyrosinilytica]|uniref:3-hydroxyacyl-[acyl-carrier-protein] dehydratase FabZ n=1 Tax=Wenjunlia tyrosinilytica TaxID=1544741 RepID=A0A918DQU4_9ACTN|nr:beta-hydroxyacyl-ACP dehydratase [Wenjunlia tyrosinilytica]GGO79916.1 3-hydroxyacyl-[acyl-carrier-protein] dehydratase FabZ [Wenjunlia tyrosinilytica]